MGKTYAPAPGLGSQAMPYNFETVLTLLFRAVSETVLGGLNLN
jgi:hypothetical protein